MSKVVENMSITIFKIQILSVYYLMRKEGIPHNWQAATMKQNILIYQNSWQLCIITNRWIIPAVVETRARPLNEPAVTLADITL